MIYLIVIYFCANGEVLSGGIRGMPEELFGIAVVAIAATILV